MKKRVISIIVMLFLLNIVSYASFNNTADKINDSIQDVIEASDEAIFNASEKTKKTSTKFFNKTKDVKDKTVVNVNKATTKVQQKSMQGVKKTAEKIEEISGNTAKKADKMLEEENKQNDKQNN